MSAILFGSISTIADTSELQRRSFNEAFAAHGLDWTWDRADYVAMLQTSGGAGRIAEFAASSGQEVDAAAVHQTKSAIFQESLADASLSPRPGVGDTIRQARSEGVKVALVTTTAQANVAALVAALASDVDLDHLDLVVDASDVEQVKPDKAAYAFALERLGEEPENCVAIEDNVGGLTSAVAAGLRCVAFPNENTSGHDFDAAARTVDRVDFSDLNALLQTR